MSEQVPRISLQLTWLDGPPAKQEPRILEGTVWDGGVRRLTIRRKQRQSISPWNRERLISEIKSIVGVEEWQYIQVMRLYSEPLHISGEQQRVIEIFTCSRPDLRIRLSAAADDVFDRGDWYIIVRGEWLDSGRQADLLQKHINHKGEWYTILRGEPLSVSPVGEAEESFFRLKLSSGQSVLLDLGRHDRPVKLSKRDDAVFLSHAHPDHTGSLQWALENRIPVYLSSATLRVLEANGRLRELSSKHRRYLRPVRKNTKIISEDICIEHHQVPHSVGSIAWSFRSASASLLYTGDVMLRSKAYNYDWRDQLRAISAQLTGRVTVLLEASRAHAGGTCADEALWPNLKNLPQDVVVVTGDNPERLLFSYARAYSMVEKPRPSTSPIFVLSPSVRQVLQACWNEIFRRDARTWDAHLIKPGINKWGLAESHALYWLDRVDRAHLMQMNRQRFWFIDKKELSLLPELRNPWVYDLRTRDTSPLDGLQDCLTERFDDRPGWTQHSHGPDIVSSAKDLMAQGIRVVLFHMRANNHKKFVQQYECNLERIEGIIAL